MGYIISSFIWVIEQSFLMILYAYHLKILSSLLKSRNNQFFGCVYKFLNAQISFHEIEQFGQYELNWR